MKSLQCTLAVRDFPGNKTKPFYKITDYNFQLLVLCFVGSQHHLQDCINIAIYNIICNHQMFGILRCFFPVIGGHM